VLKSLSSAAKLQKIDNITKYLNKKDMNNYQNRQNETPNANCMDVNFEQKLLASQLVSEVHRSTGHVSFTFTDAGVLAFAQAMQLAGMEERSAVQNASKSLFPDSDNSLITKKEAMTGFNVSHTTLWKWQKSGYLVPVKVGKRVYYRRADIESLIK
jgi:hypothetical protein